MLFEEQRRDQKATEDEEEIDTQRSTARPAERVKRDNECDCDAA